ncbi:6-hydroxymethylpterin diphosphokinase MptE-like protein [Paenibacillus sp. DMB20]|uniref:6-hydroxymethylpterin diphosphokinase MptE-like protein n=1 Tax=Paenibacillus sp. DMB20 TaxID=1642570 RepID=UPI000A978358|nr:6-hydroxymethylpterin diphosphokinase MptE-like protein [Paenibacillus sp. DMB20]
MSRMKAFFYQTISEYDVSLILEHPNFYWLSVGESQLEKLFYMVCSYMQDEMAFVALRHYLQYDMELLRGIKKKFLEYRDTFFENKFTENRFREDWTQNFLYHISDTLNTPSIEQLFYAFEDTTAVVVSSGPSLNEDIEYLKKLQPHVLIIAAGSSIQALIKQGIRPHLAVILDGHPINMDIFSNSETLKCPLLFTTSSYYGVSDLKKIRENS